MTSQPSALSSQQAPAFAQAGREKLVMAKELVEYFHEQGVEIHYAYARAIIRACPQSVRTRYVRPIDAWTFWVLHPEFQPFGGPPAAGDTRDLAEQVGNS
jgi:hypothetical protein